MPDEKMHTFAIGDIHGRADLLEPLLADIELRSNAEGFPYRVVFLGDVIDRGRESRRAMNLVADTLQQVPGSKMIIGNHDWMMLRTFEETDVNIQALEFYHWCDECGGSATLASYGLREWEGSIDDMRNGIDPEHFRILREAERYLELDRHILVHAGMRPGIPLGLQNDHDLMWIREPFLDHLGSFGKTVVHGHTPTDSGFAERYPNRIAIDVGAYRTDVLAAAHITPDGDLRILESIQHALGFVQVTDGIIFDRAEHTLDQHSVESRRPTMELYIYKTDDAPRCFARASDGAIIGAFEDFDQAMAVFRDYERRLGYWGAPLAPRLPIALARKMRVVRSGDLCRFEDFIPGFISIELVNDDGFRSFILFSDHDHSFIGEAKSPEKALLVCQDYLLRALGGGLFDEHDVERDVLVL